MFRRAIPTMFLCLSACSTQAVEPEPAAPPVFTPPEAAAPFSIPAFDDVRISGMSGDANHREATTTVDFVDGPYASATLVIDLATTCFPFESWQDNPPPSGERFPADCDAFDRLFTVTLDSDPGFEIMRAATPFGGPMHLAIDVTDLANALPGSHELTVFISTSADPAGQVSGSAGGWNLSAQLDMVPGTPPRNVLAAIPLYNGDFDSTMPPASPSFEVPEGVWWGQIEYRVTGHGGGDGGLGCIGPAEEFCQRQHDLLIDGAQVMSWVPWRDDCAEMCTLAHYGDPGFDYCEENPTGMISSVKAPRANWCPGALTEPLGIQDPSLAAPGTHTFDWNIHNIADGGRWSISATYFAYGP